MRAAIGLRPHSGWTALVALTLDHGEPRVLARRRVELVKTFTYKYRQPFHTVERFSLPRARAFIADVTRESRALARRAFRAVQTDLGLPLRRCGLLLSSGAPLPELKRILASHALIHSADGELFRDALTHGAGRCGITMLRLREKELLARAAEVLRRPVRTLQKRLTELGRPLGSPWSQDEKYAALVAWLALLK